MRAHAPLLDLVVHVESDIDWPMNKFVGQAMGLKKRGAYGADLHHPIPSGLGGHPLPTPRVSDPDLGKKEFQVLDRNTDPVGEKRWLQAL